MGRRIPTPDRFHGSYLADPATGCWNWTLALDTDGYGAFSVQNRSVKAHRYAYELIIGPIPDGLTIDHLCRNRACVNPAHMEPVTARENLLRMHALRPEGTTRRFQKHYPVQRAADRSYTHCINGHEMTPSNTKTQGGHRTCRECARRRNRESYHRLKGNK